MKGSGLQAHWPGATLHPCLGSQHHLRPQLPGDVGPACHSASQVTLSPGLIHPQGPYPQHLPGHLTEQKTKKVAREGQDSQTHLSLFVFCQKISRITPKNTSDSATY